MRIAELEVTHILIGGIAVIIMGASAICVILLVVGETVEHFTP